MTTDKQRPTATVIWQRQKWIFGLQGLPMEIKFVLINLLRYANREGVSYPSDQTIATDTSLDVVTVRAALMDAQDLSLISPVQHSASSEAWQLNEGVIPDAKWPLFRTALLGRIRQLQDITDKDQLLLEAMIDLGYRWGDDKIYVTRRGLSQRLPRWIARTFERSIEHLGEKGYLDRLVRPYGRRAGIYRLTLPSGRQHSDNSVAIFDQHSDNSVAIFDQHSDNSVAIFDQHSDNSVAIFDQHSDNSVAIFDQHSDNSVAISAAPPLRGTSQRELAIRTLPSHPQSESATQKETPFWGRLLDLDETAAFYLVDISTLEIESGTDWHDSYADLVIDDFNRAEADDNIRDPAAYVLSKWRGRSDRWDMSRASPERGRRGSLKTRQNF